MNKQHGNVYDMDSPQRAAGSNGNNGNGNGTRMALVENRLAAVESRLDKVDTRLAAVEERLAKLDTRVEYLATKEDLQAMQSTMLKWGIGIIVTSIIGVSVVLRLLPG